jgi:signal transduction histidine kinase
MLQNASIKTKLGAILLLPLLSLGVLAGMRVGDNLTRGRQADRMHDITTFALSLSGLAHELQRERDLSAGYVGSGKTSGYGRMIAQRVAVNQALKGFRGKLRRTDLGPYSQGLQARFRAAEASLARLDRQRDRIGTDQPITVAEVLGYYDDVITQLIDVNTQIPADANDSALAGTISTFVALSRAIEYTSRERGFLNAVLAGGRLPPGATRQLASIIGAEDTWLAQFRSLATPEQARQFEEAAADPDMRRAAALRRRILPDARPPDVSVDHKQWFLVMSAKIDLERAVAVRLASDVASVSQASKAAADRAALTSTVVIAVVLALTIGLSVLMARSMVRQLGLLRRAANDVAERQLPGVVDRLQTERDAPPDVAAEPAPIGITSSDEIGQVARAFESVHQVAVRIATEQALLRRDVADMFLNLARRSQSLVDRQLELIDDLEQGEPDPKALDDLFRLDHLATRMRRNAENLIVLSGAEPPRRWVEPIPLGDVVRGASAEVEGYPRVVVQRIEGVGVSGQAASDVIHLLAELLENATLFSPPETMVTVSAYPAAAGQVLEIEDRGIGIQPDELEQINRRLEERPEVDASLSRRMGLFVVGRLAARYGIRVRLRRSFYGGVTAMVLLPSEILVAMGSGELPAAGAEPAPAASRLVAQLAGAADLASSRPLGERPGTGSAAWAGRARRRTER